MPTGPFFYSKNGTDVFGPVTEDELRQLWKDNELGLGSFVRRKDESSWTPLGPTTSTVTTTAPAPVRATRIVPSEVFAKAMKTPNAPAPSEAATASVATAPVAPTAVPVAKPQVSAPIAPKVAPIPVAKAVAPTPAVAQVPKAKLAASTPAEAKATAPKESAPPSGVAPEEPQDSGVLAFVLNVSAFFSAIAAAIVAAAFFIASGGLATYGLNYCIGVAGATLCGIILAPVLISLVFRGIARVVVRSGGMVALAFFIAMMAWTHPVLPPVANAQANLNEQRHDAQKQIANQGIYTDDTSQAGQNLQKLQSQITKDGSERSKVDNDLIAVTNDLLNKAKASDTISKTCSYTLDGIKKPDDLTARIAAISQLRDSQMGVLTFLQAYDQHCRDALTADNVPPPTQDKVVADARKGAHIPDLVSLWEQKVKLSNDHIARFSFLQRFWGDWKFEYGQLNFPDDAQAEDYDKLVEAIQDDIDRIRDTQQQIFQ